MKTISCLVLALFGPMVATARADTPKQYQVYISGGNVGTVELNGGEYKLLVHRDEPKVEFREIQTGKTTEVPAKVEDTGSKFERTEIHSRSVDGANQIMEIRIGGTKLLVDFKKPS